jgi:hypothetical protein
MRLKIRCGGYRSTFWKSFWELNKGWVSYLQWHSLQIGSACPPLLMIRSAVGSFNWSNSHMKKQHFGSAFIFHTFLQLWSGKVPTNCASYADLAEYFPEDSNLHEIVSSLSCNWTPCNWLQRSTNWAVPQCSFGAQAQSCILKSEH